MTGQTTPLLQSHVRGSYKFRVSWLMVAIMWMFGAVQWSSLKSDTLPVIGSSQVARKFCCLSSACFNLLVTIVHLLAASLHIVCSSGHAVHSLRFVTIVICLWPCLIAPRIIGTLASLAKIFKKSQQNRDISWFNLFDERYFIHKLRLLKPGRVTGVPEFNVLLLFQSLSAIFTLGRLIYFEKYQFSNCKSWLTYGWITLEVLGMIYATWLAYFVYLQKVALDVKSKLTISFIDENVDKFDPCLNTIKDFFVQYLELRRFFLPLNSFILFGVSFGTTVIMAIRFGTNENYSLVDSHTTVTYDDVYIPNNVSSICDRYCTEITYLNDPQTRWFSEALSFYSIVLGVIISFTVTRLRDVRSVWNLFRRNLYLMHRSRDSEFLIKVENYVERLEPNHGDSMMTTLIFPMIGLASALLGGQHFNA